MFVLYIYAVACSDIALPNGAVSYDMNSVHGSGRAVGTVATHSCDTGWSLSGDVERTCKSDGQWQGETTNCTSMD